MAFLVWLSCPYRCVNRTRPRPQLGSLPGRATIYLEALRPDASARDPVARRRAKRTLRQPRWSFQTARLQPNTVSRPPRQWRHVQHGFGVEFNSDMEPCTQARTHAYEGLLPNPHRAVRRGNPTTNRLKIIRVVVPEKAPNMVTQRHPIRSQRADYQGPSNTVVCR